MPADCKMPIQILFLLNGHLTKLKPISSSSKPTPARSSCPKLLAYNVENFCFTASQVGENDLYRRDRRHPTREIHSLEVVPRPAIVGTKVFHPSKVLLLFGIPCQLSQSFLWILTTHRPYTWRGCPRFELLYPKVVLYSLKIPGTMVTT